MKTNSSSSDKNRNDKGNIISGKLLTKTINKIARTCEYLKRSTRKITPKSLIIGFMFMISKQRNTYSDWALEVGLLERKPITKQALYERMNPRTETFIKTVLEQQLREKMQFVQEKKIKGIMKNFNSVMIDDSTTLHLPDELAEQFPGNVSRGKKKAQAKIHAQFNLTQNNFSFFHLHSFSDNDQSLSGDVLPSLQKGDLCIRDLGFLVLDVIGKFIEKEIYFISRKNFQTKVFDTKTGIEIDLLKELRKNKFIDKEVIIGKKQQIKVRLIALPIPDAQAAQRRRKAKTDRDKRLNHSAKYYELLGYAIFITNIESPVCNAEQIMHLYQLRWRIEIIFKSWKSGFNFQKLIHRQCTNAIRVKCIIYLMLLYIYLFHVVWWNHCQTKMLTEQPPLSILKLANFFRQHFAMLLTLKSEKLLIQQIQTHCLYDKRKDRENAIQFQFKLAA